MSAVMVLDRPHTPTPAEMTILLSWALMGQGHVLACQTTEDGAMGVERPDGSPGWWAIPAAEWHDHWGPNRQQPGPAQGDRPDDA